jgi:hypothetical protein
MRSALALFFCLSSFAFVAIADAPKVLETAPIRFEPYPLSSPGLHSDSVKWIARGQGYSFGFANDETFLRVAGRTVKLTFPGANHKVQFQGESQQRASTNYFLGEKRLSVPAFSRLRKTAVYRGIDVVYYGNGREIEYDFEIAPGADPSRIRMRFDGADAVSLNDKGEIVLKLASGEITQRVPVVYQRRVSGEIVNVAAAYRIARDGTVRVALGGYDPAERLIVDPAIAYSAYLSGPSGADVGLEVAHDSLGFIYLAGNTTSIDFPGNGGGVQGTDAGNQDIWLMKIDPHAGANAIVYSSFLGGAADDTLKAMTIDKNGVFYITGSTLSGAFPVSASAIASTSTGKVHAFVSMVDPAQGASGLVYSTYLSGTQRDEGDGIAVANGKIFVTGTTDSDDFPMAGASFQPKRSVSFDAFVAEIDPTQSGAASEVYATFLGGGGGDAGRTIAVDAAGLVYVAGTTFSFDFPITTNGYQQANNGGGDAFLSVLNPATGTMSYSTFLGGGSQDEIKKLVIDPAGRVAMVGYTTSFDFPVTKNAYQGLLRGFVNVFLATLDLKTTGLGNGLTYSTFFGGSYGEVAYDLKLDSAGRYYFCGYTFSPDLPVTSNAINPTSRSGAVDGFIAVIDPAAAAGSAKALVYSSYLTSDGYQIVNGIDVDSTGLIYATGVTTGDVFPAGSAPNGLQGKYGAFVFTFTLP